MEPYEEELKATEKLGLKLIDKAHVNGEINDEEFDKLWIMICKGHDWLIRANAWREGFRKYMKEKTEKGD